MRTVVFQSFRTVDVPNAIERCLQSVVAWAATRDYEHKFLDNSLFERVPDWFKSRVNDNLLPMSDLARLMVGRELLNDGFDRAVWLDADVLVFDPDEFEIAVDAGYAFGREVWVRRGGGDKFFVTDGLHNAVCVFCRGDEFLDFYIHACEQVVRGATTEILPHQIGPDFLNRLKDVIGQRIVPDVGLFGPLVITDIAKGGGRALEAYMDAFGHPVRAANLCLSFVDRESSGVTVTDAILNRAIDQLLGPLGKHLGQATAS